VGDERFEQIKQFLDRHYRYYDRKSGYAVPVWRGTAGTVTEGLEAVKVSLLSLMYGWAQISIDQREGFEDKSPDLLIDTSPRDKKLYKLNSSIGLNLIEEVTYQVRQGSR